ncbi:MAG: hypothetical protein ACRD1K_06165, partial [Acidimicrobiales bacterium]
MGDRRAEAVVAVVAAACPELSLDQVRAAVEETITSPAVARHLSAATEAGPAVVAAGAPPVVGRLVAALRARGSVLGVPACSVCGRSGRPLVRVGTTGVCPRCRSHQLAEACSGCGRVRVVTRRTGDGAAMCFACSPRPARPCGRCGRARPIARRGRGGEADICVSCFRLPAATCGSCGRRRPCAFVAAGAPICATCSPRAVATCAHCDKQRPPCAQWPEGPVCEPCYRAALSRRGPCASCRQQRRLVSPPGAGAQLCCDCAGVPPLARCGECGIEDRLYADGRCVRCALAERSAHLLGGPRPELLAVHRAIVAARQPYSAHNWLRQAGGAKILAEIASGALALTHEALDAHPSPGAARYVRQMLVAGDVLPARDEALVALEAWVAGRVEAVEDHEHRRLLRAYATWGVLRRARQRSERAKAVRTPTRHAKTRLAAAIAFLAWLAGRQRSLADADQGDVEAWLGEGPPSANEVKDFLDWAAERKLTGRHELANPPGREGTAMDDERRWAIASRLLHDDDLSLTDRVAGCLVLLYAQQLSRIVAMTVDQVGTGDDGVFVRLGTGPALLPEPLGGLVVELVTTGRAYVGLGSPTPQSWLFPGLHPGRPLHPGHLGQRLAKLGVDARAGRRSALMHLAGQLPAAVLAEMLHLHATTAVHWVAAAGGDWSTYAA